MSAKTMDQEGLKGLVRDVPDFPKKGIVFKDITPILKNGPALRFACEQMAHPYMGQPVDQIVGIESRGFIFGSAIACQMGVGFVPARKKGKLPADKEAVSYELEYGEDHLEIHRDAVTSGTRVVIIDDLLATGGTARAVVELIEKLGGTVIGISFLVELGFLKGRDKLTNRSIHSLITY